jgi:large subunit ribosomal protein L24
MLTKSITGLRDREKGYVGRVLRVLPKTARVIVEGVNVRMRHTKPNQLYPQGGRIEQERPIHVSNVMPVDSAGNPTRVGRKLIKDPRPGRAGGSASRRRRARSSTAESPPEHSETPARRPPFPPSARARNRRSDRRPRSNIPWKRSTSPTQAALPRRGRPRPHEAVRLRQRDAGPAPRQDLRQQGRRRGVPDEEGARRRHRGAPYDHGPATGHAPVPQEHLELQAPRGHARRRERDAPRRADVGVPRPPRHARTPPPSATSAASRTDRSTGGATTRSG